MNLALETKVFAYSWDRELYSSDSVIRFEPNQLKDGDLHIHIPLINCIIEDNDEVIVTISNRISMLLGQEEAETQLKIIALA